MDAVRVEETFDGQQTVTNILEHGVEIIGLRFVLLLVPFPWLLMRTVGVIGGHCIENEQDHLKDAGNDNEFLSCLVVFVIWQQLKIGFLVLRDFRGSPLKKKHTCCFQDMMVIQKDQLLNLLI